ncbi:dihydropteroate synthase [Amycolatopsis dendrobii]|uniref:Dihydropteroate synthase n=1 Tax=Amycolatopsis dendrobii TaxID=2760662 RepID=A0A7W3VWD4_9PSEU|nr:dihydropteroate synthase [Amycolatopsis dendrobii]MBB1154478.1 dihydropteroate synthase [Amycolatopsis dendrobii]
MVLVGGWRGYTPLRAFDLAAGRLRDADLVLTHNPAGVRNKVLDPAATRMSSTRRAHGCEGKLGEIAAPGLPVEWVWLDPGIDLAKTPPQSIEMLRGLRTLTSFKLPLLIAISRKDFIGALSPSPPAERVPGTLAALAQLAGLPGR